MVGEKVCPKERHITWNAEPYPPAVEVYPKDCGCVISEDEYWYLVKLDRAITGITEQGAQEEPHPEFRPMRLSTSKIFLDKKKAVIIGKCSV
jgi:hypothetical protein